MNIDALDRLDRIRGLLAASGQVRVTDLADRFAVSEMTVRRDLDLLAEEGTARRVRGGAVAAGPEPFAQRHARQSQAKERIAAKLAEVVGDAGGPVGIDASSTMQRFAARLNAPSGAADLTVITNGPDTFATLHGRRGVTALLTGGELDDRSGSLVGPLARRAAGELLLRRLFVSAAGIDPVLGTSESTIEEADIKLALADASDRVIVAVDATKLGGRAQARCLAPERVGVLVTELEPRDARLDPYRERWELL